MHPFTFPNAMIGVGIVLLVTGAIDLVQSGDLHRLSFGILFVAGGVSWKKGWVL